MLGNSSNSFIARKRKRKPPLPSIQPGFQFTSFNLNSFYTHPLYESNQIKSKCVPQEDYDESRQRELEIQFTQFIKNRQSRSPMAHASDPDDSDGPDVDELQLFYSEDESLLPNPASNETPHIKTQSPPPCPPHQVTSSSPRVTRPVSPSPNEPRYLSRNDRVFLLKPPPALAESPPKSSANKKYACPHEGCGKVFTSSGHLTRHMRIHSGVKLFHCPIHGCCSKFSRNDNMMQHYRSHLKRIQSAAPVSNPIELICQRLPFRGPFECQVEECRQIFHKKDLMIKHYESHLLDNTLHINYL